MSTQAETCLIYDRRQELGGRPGLHALLIGVSDYPNLPPVEDKPGPDAGFPDLGLRPLSASARSADALARWVVDHHDRFDKPLATCRLLISPSAGEVASVPGLDGRGDRADLGRVTAAAKAWRDDANSHPDGIVLFYFTGHGVQRQRLEDKYDHVLLLEGFGGPSATLEGWSIKDLIDAMAPGEKKFRDIARTQYFFLDACRNAPAALEELERTNCACPLPVVVRDRYDDSRKAVFQTTEPNRLAYAHPGGLTHFAAALLKCLDGGAGELDQSSIDPDRPAWKLTAGALDEAITYYLQIENAAGRVSQRLTPYLTLQANTPFCWFDVPPRLPVNVVVDPAAACTYTQVDIIDDADSIAWRLPKPVDPHPLPGLLVSGYYRYRATPDNPAVPPRRGTTIRHGSPGTPIRVDMR